jgi:hypothetical protein
VYDTEAFDRRIVGSVDRRVAQVTLLSLRVDGLEVPDLRLVEHRGVTGINFPYRALVIEKALLASA